MTLYFLSVLLVILSVVNVTEQKKIARVIEGIPTQPCKYHYVVSIIALLKEKSFITAIHACSGTLISPKWVLTAGHCSQFDPKEIENRAVTYGDMGKNMIVKRMLKAISYPQYLEFRVGSQNDIGLVLIERIDNKMLGKLSTVDYFSLIGRPVLYVGTGLNVTDKNLNPEMLPDYIQMNLTKDFKIINERKLPRLYYRGVAVKCDPSKRLSTICVRPMCSDRGQRMQRGDSGGPLFYRGKIVGVAIAVNKFYSFVTPVSPYIDWIGEVTRDNETRKITL